MAPMALNFNFVEFSNLGAQIGSKVPFDVVGVVKEVGEQGTVKRKSDGTDLFRRDIKLVDSSCVPSPSWITLARTSSSKGSSLSMHTVVYVDARAQPPNA